MHEQLVFTAKVADFEMDYMKFGHGQKVFVVLPGMSLMSVMPMAPLCAGAYHSFTEDYTVYLFDRRKEFGLGYSVEDMAADTALVMKSLGIAHADIMGFSQGGMMAESIAENHPNLVRKLVLGSTFSRANETSNAVFDKWIRWTLEGKIETLISDFVDKLYTEKRLNFAGSPLLMQIVVRHRAIGKSLSPWRKPARLLMALRRFQKSNARHLFWVLPWTRFLSQIRPLKCTIS